MKTKLFVTMLMTAGLLMGCSNDDETVQQIVPIDVAVNEEGNIKFSLQNIKMDESIVFQENENIIFDVAITNDTNEDFILKKNFIGGDLGLDEGFFCVYREDGTKVGVPWSGMFCDESMQDEWRIKPSAIWHIRCPWYMSTTEHASFPLCKGGVSSFDWPHLTKGKYYTMFTIQYKHPFGSPSSKQKKQSYIIHFTII